MNSRKQGLLSFILAILIVIVFYLVIVEAVPKLRIARAHLRQQEEIGALLQEINSAVQSNRASYQQAQNYGIKISYALPDSFLTANVLSQIQNVASANNVIISDLDFEPPVDKKTPPPLAVTIKQNISGTYESLRSYIRKLEENLPLMDIRVLRIGGIRQINDQTIFSCELEIKTYFLK